MKFPFHKQSDTMQCGVACLRMIFEYYGHRYSNAYLSKICHTTVEGVSMLGISETAKKLGMNVVSGYLSLDSLTDIQLPCILHWNQKHFVVLYNSSFASSRTCYQ